jgi:isopenicillin-N N-acyltransferase-like protein
MLQVNCSGTHYQIGHDHGTHASLHITRSLGFYSDLFQSKCRMDWAQVTAFALLYQPFLLASFPGYVAEMEGIAAGAGPGVGYADILALNVRTEIAFGAFSDGCTALSWKQGQRSVLAQNWDWNTE